MKKNLTRKLALSAVTMGVAALTVTSTTYAWYTSNATATASTITGTAKAADGNLLIGKVTGNGKSSTDATQTVDDVTSWATTLTFDASSAKLSPVTWDSSSKQWQAVNTGNSTLTKVENTDSVIVRQTVWFNIDSVSADSELTVKMNGLSQTPNNGKNQKLAVSDTKIGGSVDNKTTSRTVKLTDVLACRITSVSLPSGVTAIGADKNYKWTSENTSNGDAVIYYNNIYGLGQYTQVDTKTVTSPASGTTYYTKSGETYTKAESLTSWAENTEYYTKSGEELVRPTNTGFENTYLSNTETTALSLLNVAKFDDTATEQNYRFGVTFEFYIDGWDYQCYNAIGGQSFAGLSLEFKLTPKTSTSSDTTTTN